MKKTLFYIAMIAIAGTTLTSCRSADFATVARDRCQIMAEDLQHFRAWGSGDSQDQAFARDVAATVARNQLAATIATGVISTINIFNSEVGGAGLTRLQEQDIIANVNEILRGARIVCTEISRRPESRRGPEMFRASVCVEVNLDVIRAMHAQFEQLIDERARARATRDEFVNRMQEYRQTFDERRQEQYRRDGF